MLKYVVKTMWCCIVMHFHIMICVVIFHFQLDISWECRDRRVLVHLQMHSVQTIDRMVYLPAAAVFCDVGIIVIQLRNQLRS